MKILIHIPNATLGQFIKETGAGKNLELSLSLLHRIYLLDQVARGNYVVYGDRKDKTVGFLRVPNKKEMEITFYPKSHLKLITCRN